jgi:uncharacterized delta-60 repeat protein
LGLFLINIALPINYIMNNKITLFLALLFCIVFNVTLAQDGANDPTFNPRDTGYGNGPDAGISSLAVQPDGKIIIGGGFQRYTAQNVVAIARINSDKTLDTSFVTSIGAMSSINTIALQPDGKMIIGGDIIVQGSTSLSKLARLNSDGSFDINFITDIAARFAFVSKIVLQSDGKVLVAGYSTTYNGIIIRLNTDGSQDTTFAEGIADSNPVSSIAIDSDGKIVVVGGFSFFNGEPHSRLARLNSNGTTDAGFNPEYGGSYLAAVAIASDGKIYVAGNMYMIGSDILPGIARYNENGSTDSSFVTDANGNPPNLRSVVVLPDGKIVVAGGIVARLNTDGSTDNTFANVRFDHNQVGSLALAANDKVIVAGGFINYNGSIENYITRLNEDGTKDTAFDLGSGTGADDAILRAISQVDGSLIITGLFKHYNGVERNGIARITQDGVLDESFNPGSGVNGVIYNSVLAPDGKVIISGLFTAYNSIEVNKLARLNTDGTLDTGFSTGTGFGSIYDFEGTTPLIDVQADGKVFVGGNFVSYNGVPCAQLIRLNTDGSIDPAFTINILPPEQLKSITSIKVLPAEQKILVASATSSAGFQNTVEKLSLNGTPDAEFNVITSEWVRDVMYLAVDGDGKILISGNYFNAMQDYRFRFMRFNANGTFDRSFIEGSFFDSPSVSGIYPQQDGKIVVTGGFGNTPQLPGVSITRLNNDGSPDDTFMSAAVYLTDIYSVVSQQDKLIIAGDFTFYGSAGRNRIARILSNGSMGTYSLTDVNNNVIAYKSNNALQITSSNQMIKSVQVYDLAGRLLSNSKDLNAVSTVVEDITATHKILIVNIRLENNTTVSKKIYY